MSDPHAEQCAVVFVVDDDAAMRDALSYLFQSVGLRVMTFASTQSSYKASYQTVQVVWSLMSGFEETSGLDFQSELANAGVKIPIIFMTAHGDIPMTVQAMKAGAIEFLTKPFREQDMLDAVHLGHGRDRRRRELEASISKLRSSFEALTPREKEVMEFVVSGLMNKQIAGKIGVSEITVKLHRGSAMRKMGAKSIADLVRIAEVLGVNRVKA